MRSHLDLLAARADPNSIDLKLADRLARPLNTLVEGKYSKRMSIQGKDNYHDLEKHVSLKKSLGEEALRKRQEFLNNVKSAHLDELDIVS